MGPTLRKSVRAAMKVLASLLMAALVLPAIVHGSSWSDWQNGWIAGWKAGWNRGWNNNGQPRGTLVLRKGAWETGYEAGENAGFVEGRRASQGQGWPRLQAGQNFYGQGQGQLFTTGFPLAGLANFGHPYPLLVPLATHVASATKTKGPTVTEAAKSYKAVSGDNEKVEGFVLG